MQVERYLLRCLAHLHSVAGPNPELSDRIYRSIVVERAKAVQLPIRSTKRRAGWWLWVWSPKLSPSS